MRRLEANITKASANCSTDKTQSPFLKDATPSRAKPTPCQTTNGILNLPGTNMIAVLTTNVSKYLNDSQSFSAVVLDCKAAIANSKW